jgi:hypothetical protein
VVDFAPLRLFLEDLVVPFQPVDLLFEELDAVGVVFVLVVHLLCVDVFLCQFAAHVVSQVVHFLLHPQDRLVVPYLHLLYLRCFHSEFPDSVRPFFHDAPEAEFALLDFILFVVEEIGDLYFGVSVILVGLAAEGGLDGEVEQVFGARGYLWGRWAALHMKLFSQYLFDSRLQFGSFVALDNGLVENPLYLLEFLPIEGYFVEIGEIIVALEDDLVLLVGVGTDLLQAVGGDLFEIAIGVALCFRVEASQFLHDIDIEYIYFSNDHGYDTGEAGRFRLRAIFGVVVDEAGDCIYEQLRLLPALVLLDALQGFHRRESLEELLAEEQQLEGLQYGGQEDAHVPHLAVEIGLV